MDEHDSKLSSAYKRAFDDVKRRIDEDLAAAHSTLAKNILNNPSLTQAETLKYLVEVYDIHAHYHHCLVVTNDGIEDYVAYLKRLINHVTDMGTAMTKSWPGFMAENFFTALGGWLVGRSSHWKSTVMKRVREFDKAERETSATAEQNMTPSPPFAINVSVSDDLSTRDENGAEAVGRLGDDEEIARREKLYAEYRSATGEPSNKSVYEAKNSGVHKPQFYAYLKGTLPLESQTCVNFERFLREKKKPVPRKTRG